MSTPFPDRATLRRHYGIQKRSAIVDVTGAAVLDWGRPPSGFRWVVLHIFVRGAAGQTVRLFIGGIPGTVTDLEEVDAVQANPAVSSGEELFVDELEPIWAQVTGLAAGTPVFGQIRYRILAEETV